MNFSLHHLIWIIPVVALIGLMLAAYWPLGKNPSPPYVGFDEDEAKPCPSYFPGAPPGTYRVIPGSDLHRQIERYQESLLPDHNGDERRTT